MTFRPSPPCRHCGAPLELPLVDLGTAPASNAYLGEDQLAGPETWYPLRVLVCQACWLVQLESSPSREQLFEPDYAYFSSASTTWLAHARAYVAGALERFSLGPTSKVVEVASNDGYLLQYVAARDVPCLGIEPTAGTAAVARARGIETVELFFGEATARALKDGGVSADLMIANNVLAHVPDINDFTRGFAILLAPHGVATFEFPHVVELVARGEFDTIYHEHYSYLSLTSARAVLAASGLEVFDVERIATHGGSLRVYAQRAGTGRHRVTGAVESVLAQERAVGVDAPTLYEGFQARVDRTKDDLLDFLLAAKSKGDSVAAYGAAAKGNTLLNYAGVRGDLLPYVVDIAPAKIGRYLPGSRIPVVAEERLRATRPAYVLVLPWNLIGEIADQLAYVRAWGGRLVTAVPELRVLP